MRLFIAEKPKMGVEIASCLPKPHKKGDGYIETGGGIVTWCIGHLIQLYMPEDYDKKYESFPGKFDDLPIIPDKWNYKGSPDKLKQISVIKKLLANCTEIVNAGDPGREGQLIIDELLKFLNNKKPVKRILLQSLDHKTIKQELNNLHDNNKYVNLYHAGSARSYADWLIGMNMSRAFSILGKEVGYSGVLSVGRVQSPTLALIVNRDLEIENFIPKDYYTVKANVYKGEKNFYGTWKPKSDVDYSNYLDSSNRIIDIDFAKNLEKKITNKKAKVVNYSESIEYEKAPLPFSLSTLNIYANAKWGYSVKEILDLCQSLYEKKLTTYPRTDSEYLPVNLHSSSTQVLEGLKEVVPNFSSIIDKADSNIKNRAWDDSKLTDHHAIIPTMDMSSINDLNKAERNIFEIICKRYIAQFYKDAEVKKIKVLLDIEDEHFTANGRVVIKPEWKTVFSGEVEEENEELKHLNSNTDEEQNLPVLKNDEILDSKIPLFDKKTTKPPARFTQGTLIYAMTHIDQYVSEPELKKKLSEVKGIGRTATQPPIIEGLIKRNLLISEGKKLISTPAARSLIKSLPKKIIDPGLTAMWENLLDEVANGKIDYNTFMKKQHDWVKILLEEAKNTKLEAFSFEKTNYNTKTFTNKKNYNSKTSNATNTKTTKASTNSKTSKKCPKCNSPMIEREIKSGAKAGNKFLGCSGYPKCNHSEWPK